MFRNEPFQCARSKEVSTTHQFNENCSYIVIKISSLSTKINASTRESLKKVFLHTCTSLEKNKKKMGRGLKEWEKLISLYQLKVHALFTLE